MYILNSKLNYPSVKLKNDINSTLRIAPTWRFNKQTSTKCFCREFIRFIM